jgi:arsenate reductase
MTEELLRQCLGDAAEVESAGIEPGTINPVVAELLKEDGIDISGKTTQSVFDLHKAGTSFDYVIAVCDPEAAERCPIFPAEKKRLHWPFPDPSKARGSLEEKLEAVRPIRDQIRAKVNAFCEELREKGRIES